jgi:hypothetical protein
VKCTLPSAEQAFGRVDQSTLSVAVAKQIAALTAEYAQLRQHMQDLVNKANSAIGREPAQPAAAAAESAGMSSTQQPPAGAAVVQPAGPGGALEGSQPVSRWDRAIYDAAEARPEPEGSESLRLSSRAAVLGFELLPEHREMVRSDGNCFFDSIFALNHMPCQNALSGSRVSKLTFSSALKQQRADHATALRAQLVSWLRSPTHAALLVRSRNHCGELIQEAAISHLMAGTSGERWEDLLDRMAKPTEYCEDAMVQAAAAVLGRDILVITSAPAEHAPPTRLLACPRASRTSSEPLVLANWHNRHFAPCVPIHQTPPPPLADAPSAATAPRIDVLLTDDNDQPSCIPPLDPPIELYPYPAWLNSVLSLTDQPERPAQSVSCRLPLPRTWPHFKDLSQVELALPPALRRFTNPWAACVWYIKRYRHDSHPDTRIAVLSWALTLWNYTTSPEEYKTLLKHCSPLGSNFSEASVRQALSMLVPSQFSAMPQQWVDSIIEEIQSKVSKLLLHMHVSTDTRTHNDCVGLEATARVLVQDACDLALVQGKPSSPLKRELPVAQGTGWSSPAPRSPAPRPASSSSPRTLSSPRSVQVSAEHYPLPSWVPDVLRLCREAKNGRPARTHFTACPALPVVLHHFANLTDLESALPVGLRRFSTPIAAMVYFVERYQHHRNPDVRLCVLSWCLQLWNFTLTYGHYQSMLQQCAPLGPLSLLPEQAVREWLKVHGQRVGISLQSIQADLQKAHSLLDDRATPSRASFSSPRVSHASARSAISVPSPAAVSVQRSASPQIVINRDGHLSDDDFLQLSSQGTAPAASAAGPPCSSALTAHVHSLARAPAANIQLPEPANPLLQQMAELMRKQAEQQMATLLRVLNARVPPTSLESSESALASGDVSLTSAVPGNHRAPA